MPRNYHVHILASRSRRLYIGVTGRLRHRVEQHRTNREDCFTARYQIFRLVYVEAFARPIEAIEREKALKGWSRARKLALVGTQNPTWDDYLPLEPRGRAEPPRRGGEGPARGVGRTGTTEAKADPSLRSG
ncbi:MAG: GIY-YIG nuclease family protein [Gemmatimonadetes bacterium]|nr:GIY-YIG nuclease family protein [Gemmatimonadota bacterium]